MPLLKKKQKKNIFDAMEVFDTVEHWEIVV